MDKNLETFLRLSDCYGVKMHRSAIVGGKTGRREGGGRGGFLYECFMVSVYRVSRNME